MYDSDMAVQELYRLTMQDAATFDRLLAEHAAVSSVKATSGSTEERTKYSQRWQVNW